MHTGRDIPIIFSGPMVRALLAGRKTMTRRLVLVSRTIKREVTPKSYRSTVRIVRSSWCDVRPGDQLWVRENFARNANQLSDTHMDTGIVYAADGKGRALDNGDEKPWTPCIHMPRSASRLTLIVTGTTTELLQNISENDAIAEGVVEDDGSEPDIFYVPGAGLRHANRASKVFQYLWESINGLDSWARNPEVVVLSFRVIRANIDAPETRAV